MVQATVEGMFGQTLSRVSTMVPLPPKPFLSVAHQPKAPRACGHLVVPIAPSPMRLMTYFMHTFPVHRHVLGGQKMARRKFVPSLYSKMDIDYVLMRKSPHTYQLALDTLLLLSDTLVRELTNGVIPMVP